jgi:hypothetical protein
LSLEPKTTRLEPKQCSADRSADHVACVHWRWREEKTFFFAARTSLNNRRRRTMAKFFCKFGGIRTVNLTI